MMNKRLSTKQFARILRVNATIFEDKAWKVLRNSQILNLKFRRQYPIGHLFVADFYCASLKLIVELDGEIHKENSNYEYDIARDTIIKELGYRIIRIENKELPDNLDELKDYLEAMIKKFI